VVRQTLLLGIITALCQVSPLTAEPPEKFTASGVVETKRNPTSYSVTETGLLHGRRYRIHYDDLGATISGTAANDLDPKVVPVENNWRVECFMEKKSGGKICLMHLRDLHIGVAADGSELVQVGDNHTPRSTIFLRIDEETPFELNGHPSFDIETSKAILERLKTAKNVNTRFEGGRYQKRIKDKWELFGFNESYEYAQWALQRVGSDTYSDYVESEVLGPNGPFYPGLGGVTVPQLIETSYAEPDYPEKARMARLEGHVILQVKITEEGSVTDPTVLRVDRPNVGFEEAAKEAVSRWRYHPSQLDGKPVEVHLVVSVQFSLR
jgi:TonB family protein